LIFSTQRCAAVLKLAFWLGIATLGISSAQSEVAVSVSPQAYAPDVREISLSFSAPMILPGQKKTTAPATVSCIPKDAQLKIAQDGWINDRQWSMNLSERLPSATLCTIALHDNLQALDGSRVKAGPWSFNTGGPNFHPYDNDERNFGEDGVVFFYSTHPVDKSSLLNNVTCRVGDSGAQALQWLDDAEMFRAARRRHPYHRDVTALRKDYPNLLAGRCPQAPLDNGAQVTITVGKGVTTPWGATDASDSTTVLKVRPKFQVWLRCRRNIPGTGECDPRHGVSMHFSALVDGDHPQLRLPDGSALKSNPRWGPEEYIGPIAEGDTVSVVLKGEIRDIDGRPLSNPEVLRKGFEFGRFPPYLGIPLRIGTLPWKNSQKIPPLWPVVVRKLDPQLEVRQSHVGGNEDEETASKAARLWRSVAALQTEYYQSSKPLPRLEDFNWPQTLFVPTRGGEIETVGVPLGEPGLYLLEVESPAWSAYFTTSDQEHDPKLFSQNFQNQDEYRRAKNFMWRASRMAWVQVTNLNITVPLGSDKDALVWVTTIDSGLPVEGARVDVFNQNGQLLWWGKTDAQGLAKAPSNLAKSDNHEGHVVVQHGKDLAVVSISWYDVNSRQRIGHTILDRKLFRQGETLNFQRLLRKYSLDGLTLPEQPDKSNVEISTTSNEIVSRLKLEYDATGSATGQWKIPSHARLGKYTLSIVDFNHQGDRIYGHERWDKSDDTTFQIEEYRAPVFEAKLEGSPEWRNKVQTLPLDMSLSYLSGGSAAGQMISLKSRFWIGAPAPRAGFSFEWPWFLGDNSSLPNLKDSEIKLDAEGKGKAILQFPTFDRAVILRTEMDFSDPNGEKQSIGQEFALWPGEVKLGLRLESPPGKPLLVRLIALDLKNAPLAGQKVVIKRQLLKDPKPDGIEPEALTALSEICTVTTDASGEGRCELKETVSETEGWQYLLLTAEASDQARRSIKAGKVVNRHDPLFHSPQRQPRQEIPSSVLSVDATPLQPGSNATLNVRAPFLPATLLLTAEREGVLASSVHRLTAELERISLPVQSRFAPNIHLRAHFVGGLNDLPNSLSAEKGTEPYLPAYTDIKPFIVTHEINVPVAAEDHRLNVSVIPAKAGYQPGSQAEVRIAVRQGQQAAGGAKVTVAVVDDALLALLPNPTWELFKAMNRPRPRTTKLYQSLQSTPLLFPARLGPATGYFPVDERFANHHHVAYSPSPSRSPSYSPPAVAASSHVVKLPTSSPAQLFSQPPRRSFNSLALWQTDLTLDAEGKASVSVPLPDNLTRWRIVAIARQGTEFFGEGEATLTTATALQLYSGLPNLLRDGDEIMQTVTVRNGSKKPHTLTFSANARLQSEAGSPPPSSQIEGLSQAKTLKLAAGQSETVTWKVAVPAGATALHWEIKVQNEDGEGDRLQISQTVLPAMPVTTHETRLVQINQPLELPVKLPEGALPGKGGISVQLEASFAQAALAEVRKWMGEYPHGCLEQKTSRIAVSGNRQHWERLTSEFPNYFDERGLLRFYPTQNMPGSEMLTALVLDIAQAAQWDIPPESRRRMLDGLRHALNDAGRIQDWMPTDSQQAHRFAMQATLAQYELPNNLLRPTDINSLPVHVLIDWIRTLLRQPESPRRQADLQLATTHLRKTYEIRGTRLYWQNEERENWWWLMRSGDSTTARFALLLPELIAIDPAWSAEIPVVLKGLIARQNHGHWGSTTANVWGTLALDAYARKYEKTPVNGETVMQFGQATGKHAWNAVMTTPVLLPWPTTAETPVLRLSHQGSGAPWATTSIKAAAPLKEATNFGLHISKTLTPIQQRVPGRYSVGDTLRVRLDMRSRHDLTWVAVRDPVPSGATILGRGLGRESQFAQSGEIRHNWQDWREPQLAQIERGEESYRAYWRWVPAGAQWSSEYTLRINNAGKFMLPPTRIEAMYAPEFFGETPNRPLQVQ